MKKSHATQFLSTIITIFLSFCLFILGSVNPGNTKVFAENYPESRAECVMELSSGRVLYENKGDLRLPMASTTKIITASTVLRLCRNINEQICIPQEAEGIEGSSVYLKAGDFYTIEELLYGLMLRSGNDCAVALALHFAKTIAEFSKYMNETAQMAGALHSRFSNPHGLPAKNHYTTARDLGYITRYAMQNPLFCQIVGTKYYEGRAWKNKNKMLFLYEGAKGVKTGYTKEAGRCLVSAIERGNMTLLCVVLNSPSMYERSHQLLDDGFSRYQNVEILPKDSVLTIDVDGKILRGKVKENYVYPLLDGEKECLEIKTKAYLSKNNKEIIGQFQIYLSKRLLFSGNLYKL